MVGGGRGRRGIKGFERKLRQLRPNVNVRDDSLATLRYLSQHAYVCVCVLLLGCSPSHTHFSTLFRAGGEKLRKVRNSQRELVVFLCTPCTCTYTTIHTIVYSTWNASHYVLETVSFYDTQVVPGDAKGLSHLLQRNCFIFLHVPVLVHVPVWQLLDFKMKSI